MSNLISDLLDTLTLEQNVANHLSNTVSHAVKRPFPSQKIAKDWVGFDPESSPSKVVIRSTIPPPIDDYSFLLYLLGNSAGLTILRNFLIIRYGPTSNYN